MFDADDLDIGKLFEMMFEREANIKRANAGHKVRKATTVYRIEMPNGRGPYNSGLPNAKEIYRVICAPKPGFDCSRNARLNNEQCGPTEAAFEQKHGDVRYGCDSLESLFDWFGTGARKYLRKLGAKIVVYQLPVGAHLATVGRGEVLFAPSECKRIDEIDIMGGEHGRLAA